MVPEIWSDRQNFLSFWAIFAPPSHYPENQNFEEKKNEKMPGDIIL